MKKILLTIICILCLSQASFAQAAISTTVTSDKTTYNTGETVLATIVLKNTNTAVAPFTVSATSNWTESAVAYSATATSAAITVVKPATVNTVDVVIPATLTYIANSAKIGATAATATLTAGKLTINVNATLNEQQSVTLTAQFKAL